MIDKNIAALASRQHGVVSLTQLREFGLTRHAVAQRAQAGRLHRVHRGVYAVGHRTLTTKGRWLAAVLSCGPSAVLSHRAALALWELRPRPGAPYDVTILADGGRRPKPGIRLHCSRALLPADVTAVDAIPVTSVARTLHDYARTASRQQLRTAVEAAERLDLFDGRAVEELMQRSPGRATTLLRTVLVELIGTTPPWTQSEFERQFLSLVREAGLPEPQFNAPFGPHTLDAFWPAARLVVELDGYRFHKGRASFERDRARDIDTTLAGLRTIRLTQRRIETERARTQADLATLLDQSNLL